MSNPSRESNDGGLRLDFDRQVMLQFQGSVVTSNAGLLAYREFDDALRLSALRSTGEVRPDERKLADATLIARVRHSDAGQQGLLRRSNVTKSLDWRMNAPKMAAIPRMSADDERPPA
jgi:hypothetical protein